VQAIKGKDHNPSSVPMEFITVFTIATQKQKETMNKRSKKQEESMICEVAEENNSRIDGKQGRTGSCRETF